MATLDQLKAVATTVAPVLKPLLVAEQIHGAMKEIHQAFAKNITPNGDDAQRAIINWYEGDEQMPVPKADAADVLAFFRARFPHLPALNDGSMDAFGAWFTVALRLAYNCWTLHNVLIALDSKGNLSSDNSVKFCRLQDEFKDLKPQAAILGAIGNASDPIIRQRLQLPPVPRSDDDYGQYIRTHKMREVRTFQQGETNLGLLGGQMRDQKNDNTSINADIGGTQFTIVPQNLDLFEFRLQRMGVINGYPTTYPLRVVQYLMSHHGDHLITLALE